MIAHTCENLCHWQWETTCWHTILDSVSGDRVPRRWSDIVRCFSAPNRGTHIRALSTHDCAIEWLTCTRDSFLPVRNDLFSTLVSINHKACILDMPGNVFSEWYISTRRKLSRKCIISSCPKYNGIVTLCHNVPYTKCGTKFGIVDHWKCW